MERRTQLSIWYFLLAFLAIVWLRDIWVASRGVEQISYDEFQQALDADRIGEVEVTGDLLRGTYKSPTADGARAFVTPRVDLELAQELEQHKVKFTGVVENTLLRDILSWVLPALLFIGLWLFLLRRFADKQGIGGMMAIGKSKAKVYMEKDTKVTFADVAGVDEGPTAGRHP